MTRLSIVVLAAVLIGTPLANARQEQTFHAGTHVVSVYATVVDRAGRLVPDLTRDDFEVFDNGKPQTLSVFANEIQPITVVIMLDRSGSMARNFELVRDAAEHFVFNLLPADKARLGSFSNRVQIDPEAFTSDRNELIRILHENLLDAGATPLWNATAAALTAVQHQDGRRVVLVFTDGVDSPGLSDTNVSLGDVLGRSQAEETMVYAIGLSDSCTIEAAISRAGAGAIAFQGRGRPGRIGGGPIGGRIGGLPIGPRPGDGRIGGRPTGLGRIGSDEGKPCASSKPDEGLRALADEGGGGYFELRGTDDLNSTFARVADELHHQYLLAFKASTLDGQLHKLEVRVRQSDMTARARKSYLAK